MDAKSKARYEAWAGIIKALAHPTRLFIVEELSKNRRFVNELTDMIGVDASTVSKHLSVLKSVGIVRDEKKGVSVYYELNTPCILGFFGCVDKVIQTTAEQRLELVKLNENQIES